MKNKTPNIPIFIINLKKDIEKKEHMQTLCQKYDLDVEFIEAFDGKALSEEKVNKVYSKDDAIKNIGRELTRGEIGTALSHRLIYQKMLNENIEYALILEDDIDFNEKLIEVLSIQVKLPVTWEVVLLGHHAGHSREVPTRYNIWFKNMINKKIIFRRPCEVGYGAYGYLITKSGAKKLNEKIYPCFLPIDHFTGNSKYVNLYIIQKPVIYIHENLTDMSNLQIDREQMEKEYALINPNESIKKKIFKTLGLYSFLVSFRKNMKLLIKKVKLLRKYQ